ncbi:hypothetical protein C1645_830101 [Glomus cerebriforme]|uniref:Uncharacterized protein n=1 Tax=Glomus cerebriforme TaxID=658196 RepID=A0A397STA9_9GLOM|nr:hypothetical protein C1645_830101 [Glomus cerebriforme]
MSFRRPHLRQRRICEEHKAKLKKKSYHLHSELQTEVDTNRQNERKIECLENASEKEIVELKSEISSLKSQLYQARKDVRDKEKYISTLKKQLVESKKQNNPLNIIKGRCLPVLKLMAPALAKFLPYIDQESPDDYLDKVI